VNCVSHTVVENLKQFAFKGNKSRVVRRTFWPIKVVPTWKKFGKRWFKEFTLLNFGLGLVAKFCLGVYSGEDKGSVLVPPITFVCCWSFYVLLKDRGIFLLYTTKPAVSSWIYIATKKFYNCFIFLFSCLVNYVVFFLELCWICLHFSNLPWGWCNAFD
jgi:hypothetical protein